MKMGQSSCCWSRRIKAMEYRGTLREILGNSCALPIPRQTKCEARGATAESSRQACILALSCITDVAKMSARPSVYRASAVPLVPCVFERRGRLTREALWPWREEDGKYLSANMIDRSTLRQMSACHFNHHFLWLVMLVCHLPEGMKSKDLQAHMLEPSSCGTQKERFGRWDMIAIRVMLGAFTDGD